MVQNNYSRCQIEDLAKKIEDTENRLGTIRNQVAQLDSEEVNAAHVLRREIKEVDQIRDAWKGPEANQFVDQIICEYERAQHSMRREADRMRDELRDEESHLRRKRDSLQEDFDSINKEENM